MANANEDTGNESHGTPTRARSRWSGLFGLLPVLSMLAGIVGLLVTLSPGTSGAAAATLTSGGNSQCRAKLVIGPSTATAIVLHGCRNGEYWLASWATQSDNFATSHPQRLFDSAGPLQPGQHELTVNLPNKPPCFFQVDFALRSSPPGQPGTRHIVVAQLGQTQDCMSPTPTPTSPSPTPTSPSPTPTPTSPTPTPSSSSPAPSSSPSPTVSVAGAASSSPPSTTQVAAESLSQGQAAGTTQVAGSSQSLPFTGFPVGPAAFAALFLVGCGTSLLRLTRRGARS
jgi:hypothetical protein